MAHALPDLILGGSPAQEIRSEERDAVGQHAGVVDAAASEGHALVYAEQFRLSTCRAILDQHVDVLQLIADPLGQPVERVGDELLEPFGRDPAQG